MPPTIIKMPGGSQPQQQHNFRPHQQGYGGVQICCCRLFTCVNVQFLGSRCGLLKLFQVLVGSFCQWLLLEFGMPVAADIGQPLVGFVTAVASSLTTATILLGCYAVSARTQQLLRQSLFEVIFNGMSCFAYVSAATCMAYTTRTWLYAHYVIERAYIAYPTMVMAYGMGYVAAGLHGLDAFDALRQYRSCR